MLPLLTALGGFVVGAIVAWWKRRQAPVVSPAEQASRLLASAYLRLSLLQEEVAQMNAVDALTPDAPAPPLRQQERSDLANVGHRIEERRPPVENLNANDVPRFVDGHMNHFTRRERL